MQTVVCALLCLVAGVTSLDVTQFSLPESVEVGEDVRLECQYELPSGQLADTFKWWYIPDGRTDQRIIIYQRLGTEVSYVAHGYKSERDVLNIREVQPQNSGYYECEVSDDVDETRVHRHLSVYSKGTGPQLSLEESEGERVVACNASDVAPRPDLILMIDSVEVTTKEELESSDDGFFRVTATANATGLGEKSLITCEMIFEDESVVHPQFIDKIEYEHGSAGLSAEGEVGESGESGESGTTPPPDTALPRPWAPNNEDLAVDADGAAFAQPMLALVSLVAAVAYLL